MIPGDDLENARWVRDRLNELDVTPRKPNWRYRASGMTQGQAAALAPRVVTLNLRIPVGEMRIVNDVAARRGVSASKLIRRCVGTILVACEDYPVEAVPFLLDGELVMPR